MPGRQLNSALQSLLVDREELTLRHAVLSVHALVHCLHKAAPPVNAAASSLQILYFHYQQLASLDFMLTACFCCCPEETIVRSVSNSCASHGRLICCSTYACQCTTLLTCSTPAALIPRTCHVGRASEHAPLTPAHESNVICLRTSGRCYVHAAYSARHVLMLPMQLLLPEAAASFQQALLSG
jgi:hypothetical protein